MRSLRAAAVLIAIAAALVIVPAHADDDGLSASLSVGWDGGATAGSWVPYAVTLKNEGQRDFNGTLVLRPKMVLPPGAPPGFVRSGYVAQGTTYQMPIVLARGVEKRVTIYGQFTDASTGGQAYEAQLLDHSGNGVALSAPSNVSSAVLTVGLLSDSGEVANGLRSMPRVRGSGIGVVAFTAQTLPSVALHLGGLAAVVIDNFDTATLSQAQLHALQQYVGLGGTLILAGGGTWRRTLASLPAGLLPLRPDATASVSLAPLMELVKQASGVEAVAATGRIAAGARPVLHDLAGRPLLVEGTYGAGRIIELTFNPAEEPVLSHPAEYRESWAAAINRIGGGQTVVGKQFAGAVIITGGPGQMPVNVGRQNLEYQLTGLLGDTAANALPALGLLGLLLVAYILLAGPVNYLLLRGLRRRELMWVTVPLVALIATAGAYGAGVVAHGSDYVVNELQLLRLSPDGSGDATIYDAIYSPRRGDLAVQLPGGSLASTAFSPYSPYGGMSGTGATTANDRLEVGRNPVATFRDVTVWSPRNLKLEVPLRDPVAIEAHLKLANGRISGTLVNHGRGEVHSLGLFTVDGRVAWFGESLPPGGSLPVDAALAQAVGYSPMTGMICSGTARGTSSQPAVSGKSCVQNTGRASQRSQSERGQLLMQGAAQAMSNGSGSVQALVGLTQPLPSVMVAGAAPARTALSAFVLPVEMESMDSLNPGWTSPRLVASSGGQGGPSPSITVLDFELPALGPGGLTLNSGLAAGMPTTFQRAQAEIYDWTANSWSPIDISRAVKLTDNQRGPGLVRVRVVGNVIFQNLQITSDNARLPT